jgi:hypothetical protein
MTIPGRSYLNITKDRALRARLLLHIRPVVHCANSETRLKSRFWQGLNFQGTAAPPRICGRPRARAGARVDRMMATSPGCRRVTPEKRHYFATRRHTGCRQSDYYNKFRTGLVRTRRSHHEITYTIHRGGIPGRRTSRPCQPAGRKPSFRHGLKTREPSIREGSPQTLPSAPFDDLLWLILLLTLFVPTPTRLKCSGDNLVSYHT